MGLSSPVERIYLHCNSPCPLSLFFSCQARCDHRPPTKSQLMMLRWSQTSLTRGFPTYDPPYFSSTAGSCGTSWWAALAAVLDPMCSCAFWDRDDGWWWPCHWFPQVPLSFRSYILLSVEILQQSRNPTSSLKSLLSIPCAAHRMGLLNFRLFMGSNRVAVGVSNTGFENFLTGFPMHLHSEDLPSNILVSIPVWWQTSLTRLPKHPV